MNTNQELWDGGFEHVVLNISNSIQQIIDILPMNGDRELIVPESFKQINHQTYSIEETIDHKETQIDHESDYKRLSSKFQANTTMISKSFDENLSESKDLNDVNFALSSNFDDSENCKKLDDISDINTSPMLQTKIVKSLSMLKSGQRKKIVDLNERQQILLSSKTAASILEFNQKYFNIEVEKGSRDVQIIFKCKFNDCRKNFNKAQNFVTHLRMHLGIKKYACEHCDKQFTQKGNMLKHAKHHEVPQLSHRKTIKCEYCSSRFTEKYNCQSHIKSKHPELFQRLRD